MAKKRKVELDDDDHTDSDASFEPKKKRGKVVDRKPAKRRTSLKGNSSWRRDLSNALEYMDEADTADSPETLRTRPHSISLHVISHAAPLRELLLHWYEGVHASRGMPWRKPYDRSCDAEQKAQRAYEVWVSEIMLQQTQVATVIPYYNRWMDKFPTITDLAASDIDTVNGLWKGLGYYSRAARLLSGAQKVVKEFDGRLPDNAKNMENKIPGIGRYSAGAICSIAYNERVPVLDGNVHRLLSRILALHAPPKAKQTLDILWAGASAFVQDADRPGDLNQALIELGATVCKVRDPSCNACPVQRHCAAYSASRRVESRGNTEGTEDNSASEGYRANGAKSATSPRPSGRHAPIPDIEELCTLCEPLPDASPVTTYPMKVEKKKAREELDIVNVIEWRTNRNADASERWFLLVRRPEGGLLAGLHEFPTAANVPVTTSSPAQAKIADTLLSALLVSPPASSPSRSPLVSNRQSEEQSSGSEQDPRQSRTTRRPRPEAKPTPAGPSAAADADTGAALRVVKIVPAGDVLHIFSHIRKTYRAQWVILEGGAADCPPPLAQEPDAAFPGAGAAIPKTSKGKTSSRKHRQPAISPSPSQLPHINVNVDKASPSPPPGHCQRAQAQWVMLDAVADANISTGVLKVWRQVRALWEGAAAGGR
ncbi:DNA glycosylase [Ganoderma leucocontextum]|nr:DNA glycosylase [Ganoderma leucocontextum]